MNLDTVLKLMRHIESQDSSWRLYIGGGYLRDTEHGVTPKDVDVMVVPDDSLTFSDDFYDLVNTQDELKVEKCFVDECQYMSDMTKRSVSGLIMCEFNGEPLQFIIYGKKLSQEELTLDMDINICQITCDSSGLLFTSENYIDGFKNKEIKVLHDYSEKRKHARVQRMLEKYPDFKHTKG